MSVYQAVCETGGAKPAADLLDALSCLVPEPAASGVHDRNDGSGIWEVSAYFEEKPDETGLALLAAAHGAGEFTVEKVVNRDWIAHVRAELTPVRAGRFIVYGSHDADSIPSNLIGLEIEAALAFGTGHHATTQGCLEALDGLVRQGFAPRSVADIGGGTGVLAMAAARVFPCPVIATDIDPVATETAVQNIAANRLTGRVRCATGPGFRPTVLRPRAPFDLIFANILAGPLKRLAPDMSGHMAHGGIAILSGILTRQAKSVEKVYQGFGYACLRRLRREEWTTLVLQKR